MPEAATAIIVAVHREARPLIRRLGLVRTDDITPASPTWTGQQDGRSLRLIETGMGPTNARRAIAALLALQGCDQVIVTGLCGALDPALQVGDLVAPDEVLDAATGHTHRRPIPHRHGGRLVSVARVIASPAEKAELFARHAAAAVDMETATIAAACETHEVPWLCLRAVSDTADQALPDGIERLIDDHGRLRPWPAVRQLARAPGTIPALADLARSTARATEAMAAALALLLAELPAH